MKEILHNKQNLNKDDITETVTRTKALIINSKNEVLLGYCEKQYQFPGGHLEEGETLVDCLKREVQEETGIVLNITEANPIYAIRYYNKDWPSEGLNRCTEIYFYVVRTDEPYNLENTNYDEGERVNNFELRYIKLDEIEKILTDSIPDHPKNEFIVPEMLEIFKEYKNNNKNDEIEL
jgi:8-oxo-dGTP pyrophosphatase MutT (NUDIX family)